MDYHYPIAEFSLKNTLECGQSFRWRKNPDGSYSGVAGGYFLQVKQEADQLCFYDTTPEEFELFWKSYFDLETDYPTIYQSLCEDETVRKAYAFTGEIHILRQDAWEGLCSFIISQNNNIPRITGIIDRLCQNFGERLAEGSYAFPTPERLAQCTMEDLVVLRAGFRAKYILDAARKVADKTVNLNTVAHVKIEEARTLLQQISGVGPKVAECALLFGCARYEAFPVDVWIKRALAYFYPNGFPETLRPYGGIAQQVIFHYIRCCEGAMPPDAQRQAVG